MLREFGMETVSFPAGQPDRNWNVIDWSAVQSQVPGNPLIVHRNLGGFSKPYSGGAFGWMEPKTLDSMPPNYDGTDELNWFYSNAVANYGPMPAFGAVWKGFNDILADWSPAGGRHIEQNCGQTWLRTFEAVNRQHSAARQLPVLQLITWNDYEEGTELETGIENCVTVSAGLSGSKLWWNVTGDESTLHRYTVFISSDGEQLAQLGDFAPGSASIELSAFNIPAGTYSLFVKAVGKPSLRNQMSAPVVVTLAGGSFQPGGKNVTITATPSSVQVALGQAGQFTLSIAQTGASEPVSMSCSNRPAGATCIFAPGTITPGSQPVSVTLTVATSSTTAALHRNGKAPLLALWLPGALGLVMLPGVRRRYRRAALLPLVFGLVLLQLACGGGPTKTSAGQSASSATMTSGTYSITVTATSPSVSRSTQVTLTIN